MKNLLSDLIAVSLFIILPTIQSCAQEPKNNLPLKTIYEVAKAEIQQHLSTYGLHGPVKSVKQKQYMANKEQFDLSQFEVSDIRKDGRYALLASMNSDCKLNFDQQGKVIHRVGKGKKFASDAVETDTLYYNETGALVQIDNSLIGDDFEYVHTTVFEYDGEGRLQGSNYNEGVSVREITYHEDKNQIRTRQYDQGAFFSDYLNTYDVYGREIERQRFSEDGSPEVRWERIYDEQGRLEKEMMYMPDGDVQELKAPDADRRVQVYEQYDDYGNSVKRLIIEPDGRTTVRERVFEYYP